MTSSRVLAEGVNADAGAALAQFEDALQGSGLSNAEITALQQAACEYHDRLDQRGV